MDKIKCRECEIEFRPTREWQVFCCEKHRKDFNNREDRREAKAAAIARAESERDARANGHVNGAAPKLSLAALGLVESKPQVAVHRRRLVPTAKPERERKQAVG